MPKGIYLRNKKMRTGKHMIGRKRSEDTKKKMAESHRGERNYLWKGEKASYRVIHTWVQHWRGKPQFCEMCGKEKTKPKSISWANIDHKYRRVLDDYIALCSHCHKKYDLEFNNKS